MVRPGEKRELERACEGLAIYRAKWLRECVYGRKSCTGRAVRTLVEVRALPCGLLRDK